MGESGIQPCGGPPLVTVGRKPNRPATPKPIAARALRGKRQLFAVKRELLATGVVGTLAASFARLRGASLTRSPRQKCRLPTMAAHQDDSGRQTIEGRGRDGHP